MGNLYNLYCDESGIDSGGGYYFGALLCSAQRARVLRKQLEKVKIEHDWNHEIKFSKLPKFQLSTYKAYAEVFLNDPYSQLFVTKVRKNLGWISWGANEKERFFKSYYAFLRSIIGGAILYNEYNLYLDYTESKWYQWSKLQYAINNGLSRDYNTIRRKFVKVYPVNSKSENLIQLVDILLGSIATNASSITKVQLSQHICQRLSDATRSHKPKFTIREWTPNSLLKKQ